MCIISSSLSVLGVARAELISVEDIVLVLCLTKVQFSKTSFSLGYLHGN